MFLSGLQNILEKRFQNILADHSKALSGMIRQTFDNVCLDEPCYFNSMAQA